MRSILQLTLIFGLLMAGACTAPTASNEPVAQDQGTIIDPPVELTDFTMPSSQGGQPLSLSDLRGQPVLLFFGYTFCPDVCPTTLSEFKQTRELLGAAGDNVRYVFVSVDPERDTPAVLARFVGLFAPTFIGLQGDEATLRQIGAEYGLYYQKQSVAGTSAAYLIDHSAAAYLIDAQGRLRTIYSYGTTPEVIAAGIQRLLDEG